MIGHDEFREAFAAGDEPPSDSIDHRRGCVDCGAWAARMERILSAAPTLVADTPTVDLTEAVLARTTGRIASTRRLRVLAAAAIVAVLAIGAMLAVSLDRDRGPTDRLATIADSYEATGEIRFVYEATATVTIDLDNVAVNDQPPEPVGVVFPTCVPAGESTQPSPAGVDLSSIIELLQSDEPCVALAAVSADATALVDDALIALTGDRRTARAQLEQLTTLTVDDDLQRATIDALIEQRRHELDRLDADIARILDTAADVTKSLEPIASATDAGIDPTGFTAAAQTDLDALVTLIDETTTGRAAVDDLTVTWTQLATGQWTPNGVTVSGVTTNDTSNAGEAAFDDAASDPLGLAGILLAAPQRLIDLLESAPADDGSIIRWPVPADILPAVDGEPWAAAARLDGAGQLDVLTLTAADIEIEFVAAR